MNRFPGTSISLLLLLNDQRRPLNVTLTFPKIARCFILAVVTLQTFYLGKFDLLTVYLGKLDFQSVTYFSLGILPRGNFIVWVLDMSREQTSFPWQLPQSDSSSAKVLMTEPDNWSSRCEKKKKNCGARVVYVFAFLHLARWISVRNNSEIKEKTVSLIS